MKDMEGDQRNECVKGESLEEPIQALKDLIKQADDRIAQAPPRANPGPGGTDQAVS